jgi:iron(III) transport system permease protein
MINKKPNFWFVSSFLVSIFVAIPIMTVFLSYFSSTSEYLLLLKNTFLIDYILNSSIILIGVLSFALFFGVLSA